MKEQRRLSAAHTEAQEQLTEATSDITELRNEMSEALEYADTVNDLYVQADDTTKQLLNQELFAGVFIGNDPGELRIELNKPHERLP